MYSESPLATLSPACNPVSGLMYDASSKPADVLQITKAHKAILCDSHWQHAFFLRGAEGWEDTGDQLGQYSNLLCITMLSMAGYPRADAKTTIPIFPKSSAISLYSMLKVVKAAMLIRSISGSGNCD